jgi:hypothetical protein
MNLAPTADSGVSVPHHIELLGDDRYGGQVRQVNQPGAKAVIDIVIVIRDLVGNIRKLRLEAGLLALQKAFSEFSEIARVRCRAVFQDALAGLVGQIQAGKIGMAFLQLIDDA